MQRVALVAAAVFATLVLGLILWELRSIVLLFVVATGVAAMVRQPVDFLVRRRIPQGLAMLAIFGIGIAAIAGVLFIAFQWLGRELPNLTADLNRAYARAYGTTVSGNMLMRVLSDWLPHPGEVAMVPNAGEAVPVETALDLTVGVVDAFAQSILVIVLAAYLTVDQVTVERLWLSLLRPDRRTRTRDTMRRAADGAGAYLRSEAAQTLLAGVLLFLGFAVLGVKYPMALAVMCALLWLLPIVGGPLALVPTAVVGLFTGPQTAVLASAFVIVIFAVMEFAVEPRLHRRRRYASMWTVIAALILLEAFGLLGLLVAPVVAQVVQIVVDAVIRPPAQAEPPPPVGYGALRERLALAHAELDKLDNPSQRTRGLLSRLDELLNDAEEAHISRD